MRPGPEAAAQRASSFHYDWHWFWDYGNGDLGNQGVHEMDKARWGLDKTRAAQVASSASAAGSATIDDGETANTQLCVFDYGDSAADLRGPRPADDGLRTPARNAAKGAGQAIDRQHLLRHEGFLVCPNYNSGIAYSAKDGEVLQRFERRRGRPTSATSSRRPKNQPESLNAPAIAGHVSAAACHMANMSHRLGTAKPLTTEDPFGKNDAANETYRRFRDHLKENGVALDKTNFVMGREIKFNSKTEAVVGDPEASKLLTREYRKPYVVPENV